MAWCKERGGSVTDADLVQRVAQTGTGGRYSGNVERDFQTLIRTFQQRVGANVSSVPTRMWNPQTSQVVTKELDVIFPDDMAAALWALSPEVFQSCLLGDGSVAEYWAHVRSSAWFSTHPAKDEPYDWGKVIPLGVYGDEIVAYRNSECGTVSIVGWCSDLATTLPFMQRYFLIACYSEHEECFFTYSDIMTKVSERICQMVAGSQSRRYPWEQAGFHFVMSSLHGDQKWVVQHYGGIHNFRQNEFCGTCLCVKTHRLLSMTLADFRREALHANTMRVYDTQDLQRTCVLYSIPGCHPQRVMHDIAHSQYLGTGKVLNASCLVFLCESGMWGDMSGGRYDEKLQEKLRAAHRGFLQWKKLHKLCASQPRFTCARVNRKHRTMWPVLNSKAVASKCVSFWLAHLAAEWAARPDANIEDRTVSVCVFSYCKALNIMKEGGAILTRSEANQFCTLMLLHLQSYAWLHKQSSFKRGKQVGRRCWMLLPKHHHLYHLALATEADQINPRSALLLSAESWMGKIGRIARATHRSTISSRTIQRYLAVMHLELSQLRRRLCSSRA